MDNHVCPKTGFSRQLVQACAIFLIFAFGIGCYLDMWRAGERHARTVKSFNDYSAICTTRFSEDGELCKALELMIDERLPDAVVLVDKMSRSADSKTSNSFDAMQWFWVCLAHQKESRIPKDLWPSVPNRGLWFDAFELAVGYIVFDERTSAFNVKALSSAAAAIFGKSPFRDRALALVAVLAVSRDPKLGLEMMRSMADQTGSMWEAIPPEAQVLALLSDSRTTEAITLADTIIGDTSSATTETKLGVAASFLCHEALTGTRTEDSARITGQLKAFQDSMTSGSTIRSVWFAATIGSGLRSRQPGTSWLRH